LKIHFVAIMSGLTLDDLKQKVGKPWLSLKYDIERGMVARFTQAVGDVNPRWQGKEAQAPPALLATLGFETAISALLGLDAIVLHGSTDLELYGQVRVGDTINVDASISALRERQTAAGLVAFITLQKDYTNQDGAHVAMCRQLAIVRPGASS
jgi:hypothetical protein